MLTTGFPKRLTTRPTPRDDAHRVVRSAQVAQQQGTRYQGAHGLAVQLLRRRYLWPHPRLGTRAPRGSAAFGDVMRHLMLRTRWRSSLSISVIRLRRGARRSCGVIRAATAQQLANKQMEKDNKAKQQRSRNIAASALVESQHAGRQQTTSSAFNRVSAGGADEAIAALFFWSRHPARHHQLSAIEGRKIRPQGSPGALHGPQPRSPPGDGYQRHPRLLSGQYSCSPPVAAAPSRR